MYRLAHRVRRAIRKSDGSIKSQPCSVGEDVAMLPQVSKVLLFTINTNFCDRKICDSAKSVAERLISPHLPKQSPSVPRRGVREVWPELRAECAGNSRKFSAFHFQRPEAMSLMRAPVSIRLGHWHSPNCFVQVVPNARMTQM